MVNSSRINPIWCDYRGKSTDRDQGLWPSRMNGDNVVVNSSMWEWDTGKVWVYDEDDEWHEAQ